MATLYLPGGWLGRIHHEIDLAVRKKQPTVKTIVKAPNPEPRVKSNTNISPTGFVPADQANRCPFCAAVHACPGCGVAVPANLEYDDICTACLEWRFRRVFRTRAENPEIVSLVHLNYCPAWERVPPSEVAALKARAASLPSNVGKGDPLTASERGKEGNGPLGNTGQGIAPPGDQAGAGGGAEVLRTTPGVANEADLHVSNPHQPPSPNPDPFIPTSLQERILSALEQKALTLDALALKLKEDRSRVHRDGLKELQLRNLVKNNRRVGGYYRPDSPPQKYEDILKNSK